MFNFIIKKQSHIKIPSQHLGGGICIALRSVVGWLLTKVSCFNRLFREPVMTMTMDASTTLDTCAGGGGVQMWSSIFCLIWARQRSLAMISGELSIVDDCLLYLKPREPRRKQSDQLTFLLFNVFYHSLNKLLLQGHFPD